MAHFPDTLNFTGFNSPSRVEADIIDLVHEGVIPPELNGAFFGFSQTLNFRRDWKMIFPSTATA